MCREMCPAARIWGFFFSTSWLCGKGFLRLLEQKKVSPEDSRRILVKRCTPIAFLAPCIFLMSPPEPSTETWRSVSSVKLPTAGECARSEAVASRGIVMRSREQHSNHWPRIERWRRWVNGNSTVWNWRFCFYERLIWQKNWRKAPVSSYCHCQGSGRGHGRGEIRGPAEKRSTISI